VTNPWADASPEVISQNWMPRSNTRQIPIRASIVSKDIADASSRVSVFDECKAFGAGGEVMFFLKAYRLFQLTYTSQPIWFFDSRLFH